MGILQAAKTVQRGFKKASSVCEKLGVSISIAYGIIVFLLVFSGVLLRTGFTLQTYAGIRIVRPFAWSEELARWFLVGLAVISASVAFKRKEHVGIELIVEQFPLKLKRTVAVITDLMILFFMVVCLNSSYTVALQAARQTGDVIPISMLWVKMNIPLGFAFMIVHALSDMISQFFPEESV
ncbi:TRAP transporter small permease [Marispirochaeta sp.]|jgi:TRAP-type transport system small permease protein|uniref:TRAP transporter small permease n=1 Tax=Marispirochaeta sp. TaxID=2038653 RepID=UPI0029C7785A|nr:TRAP transporter small permease [Marispirochaeta sp.]